VNTNQNAIQNNKIQSESNQITLSHTGKDNQAKISKIKFY